MTLTAGVVDEAATRIRTAQETKVACAPVRDLLDGLGIAEAYAVQARNTDDALAAGARVAGCKVGLTAKVVQRQLGVDRPDFGVLLADRGYGDDEPVPLSRLLQPRIEAEVAFVLERDLPERHVNAVDILRATAFVLPALEIVDSRIAGWDITILDTVADNASSGLFTLGLKPTLLHQVDLRTAAMELTSADAVVSEGSGAACLGHPVNAVVWLANTLFDIGRTVKAGEVILSGALGPMVAVSGPGTYEATIGGLGSVRAAFIDE